MMVGDAWEDGHWKWVENSKKCYVQGKLMIPEQLFCTSTTEKPKRYAHMSTWKGIILAVFREFTAFHHVQGWGIACWKPVISNVIFRVPANFLTGFELNTNCFYFCTEEWCSTGFKQC
jgi:hypothetical protein